MKLSINIDWYNVGALVFFCAMLTVPVFEYFILQKLNDAEFRANLTVQYPEPEAQTSYCHWLPDESGFVCVTQTASQMLKEQADVY